MLKMNSFQGGWDSGRRATTPLWGNEDITGPMRLEHLSFEKVSDEARPGLGGEPGLGQDQSNFAARIRPLQKHIILEAIHSAPGYVAGKTDEHSPSRYCKSFQLVGSVRALRGPWKRKGEWKANFRLQRDIT